MLQPWFEQDALIVQCVEACPQFELTTAYSSEWGVTGTRQHWASK